MESIGFRQNKIEKNDLLRVHNIVHSTVDKAQALLASDTPAKCLELSEARPLSDALDSQTNHEILNITQQ